MQSSAKEDCILHPTAYLVAVLLSLDKDNTGIVKFETETNVELYFFLL